MMDDFESQTEFRPEPPARWLRITCVALGIVIPALIWAAIQCFAAAAALSRTEAAMDFIVPALFGAGCLALVATGEYFAVFRLDRSMSSGGGILVLGVATGAAAMGAGLLGEWDGNLPQWHGTRLLDLLQGPPRLGPFVEGMGSLVVAYYLFTLAICHFALAGQIQAWRPNYDPYVQAPRRQQPQRRVVERLNQVISLD